MKEKVLTESSVWYDVTNNEMSFMAYDYEIVISEFTMVVLAYNFVRVKNEEELEHHIRAISSVFHSQEDYTYLKGQHIEYFLSQFFELKGNAKDISFYYDLFIMYQECSFEELQEVPRNPSGMYLVVEEYTIQANIYRKLLCPEGVPESNKPLPSTLHMTKAYVLREFNKYLAMASTNFVQFHDLPPHCDLYIACLDSLFRLTALENIPITDDDCENIYHLLYFKGMDYYWTKDPKMIRLIKMANLEHILYPEREEYHRIYRE